MPFIQWVWKVIAFPFIWLWRAIVWFYNLSTKTRLTARETVERASGFNDWVSLLNNATWSGGAVFAIELLKTKSQVAGPQWLLVTIFEGVLIALTVALAVAAAMVVGDVAADGKRGWKRFLVALGVIVALALVGVGFLGTLDLLFKEMVT
ncbi:hypothetical protein [Rhizobium laguerreae]|uniref:hypothetical protein n=1 Tax=Rhizobium laguerreae TaxID=1076926 RepID=UPI001C909957|nr:hypothetical protein [Rhizobium laguerreae]MBY3211496.1 hypothetical protein [Rhizobium laguerreae]